MTDTISLTGVVATEPKHLTTNDGLEVTTFRLASSQRRFDRSRNAWVDAGTNWYTVASFRQLAANLAQSISKGDRVVATGRLRIREWQGAERSGITVEIEAEAVGHDMAWGRSLFTKTVASSATAPGLSNGAGFGQGSGSSHGAVLSQGFGSVQADGQASAGGGAADWNSSFGQGVLSSSALVAEADDDDDDDDDDGYDRDYDARDRGSGDGQSGSVDGVFPPEAETVPFG
ncbi:hypothetical protein BH09ACT6_BH09ACT6_09580 [soil metagenome]